jgi:hypothetical protein
MNKIKLMSMLTHFDTSLPPFPKVYASARGAGELSPHAEQHGDYIEVEGS